MFFLFLDAEPLSSQFLFVGHLNITENMGMSTDHFVVDGRKNIGGGKLLLFSVQAGQHSQYEENIANFFTDILMTAMINGLNQFLAFFKEIFF